MLVDEESKEKLDISDAKSRENRLIKNKTSLRGELPPQGGNGGEKLISDNGSLFPHIQALFISNFIKI